MDSGAARSPTRSIARIERASSTPSLLGGLPARLGCSAMASDDSDVEMEEVARFEERPTETFSLALQNVASGRGFDREGADDDSGAEWDEVEATVDAPAPPKVAPRTAEPLEIVIEKAPSHVIGGKVVGPKCAGDPSPQS